MNLIIGIFRSPKSVQNKDSHHLAVLWAGHCLRDDDPDTRFSSCALLILPLSKPLTKARKKRTAVISAAA